MPTQFTERSPNGVMGFVYDFQPKGVTSDTAITERSPNGVMGIPYNFVDKNPAFSNSIVPFYYLKMVANV